MPLKKRKDAEENLYGNFLQWFQKTYPDRWEKLKESMKE